MPSGSTSTGDVDRVLDDGGDAGELARRVDWAATALGPASGWSQALRSTAALVLHSHWPMLLWWGPEFVQIYNDAYRPVLGDKHPRAMGQRFRDCWAEVFDILGPLAERPFRGGPAATNDDIPLLLDRNVAREETHFRIAYSPVPDDTVAGTGIGGVLAIVTETTDQVYAERQLRTLRALGDREMTEPKTAAGACAAAAATLSGNPQDVPFALLFLLDPDGRHARLAGSAGFGEPPAAFASIDLDAGAVDGTAPAWRWPIAEAIRDQRAVAVDDLAVCPVALPCSPWGSPARSALVLPLSGGPSAAYGALVCGVSAHRVLGTGYRTFLDLVAAQIATAIGNVRALEHERRRAEALAEIDRAKTAFFSNVSHEFRTPLTLMLGPLHDAVEPAAGALAGEDLRAVHRNAQRLLKLVNSLLEFSRIEAGRARPTYQPTDLAAFTRDVASAFRSAVEDGGLRFDVRCDPIDEPGYVDRDLWERIVLNLLSNAFKFTHDGAITVAQRAVGDAIVLEVRDTGVGIAAGELPRVFERFHRIDGSRGRTHEGSGIGLALVHDMVALHGGTIDVTSRPGQGTTFTVTLPRGARHLPPERVVAAAELTATSRGAEPFVAEALRWVPVANDAHAAPASGRARILVVDDNADMREYLARLLSPLYAVELAGDGVEALALVRASCPDLIVVDVMMPRLDGFGFLREVRGDPRFAHVPVLMLSARAGDEARVEGLQAGADDYLVKPFSAKELRERVRVHLDNARARRAAATERDRLRGLLGELPAIVNFLRGPDLVIEYIHPRAAAALGDRPLRGLPLEDAIPEFRAQEYPTLLRRVIATGERIERAEQLVRLDDGKGGLRDTFWTFVYLPMRDDGGRIDGVMTFDLDVTEQVLARREAEHARGLAEAANRAKDEFLAMLGHELRNPLAPIVTALEIVRARGAQQPEHALIERQVHHLIRLVEDLLDISRIMRGKIALHTARAELADVVQRGLEVAAPLLESRHQRVENRVARAGLAIDVDGDRMAQVIGNLLTNAAKYSEPGSTIRLAAERDGDRVRLRVRDEGIGIAPDLLHRVFDVFFQQPQSIDRAAGGLGLGLAIVRTFVELHGGTVRATSEGPGTGSEFIVELPLAPAAQVATSAAETAAPAAMGKRILLVDDNVDAVEILSDLLRMLGNVTEVAHDGFEALRVASRFQPEICLVDIGLPEMDGYELTRRLRASQDLAANVRVIAVSGYGQDADRERSLRTGFDAHLVKPVSIDRLVRAITGTST